MIKQVYLGLGGNQGETKALIQAAIQLLQSIPQIKDVRLSPLYLTTPVSTIPQDNYINGVCGLKTSLNPEVLWDKLCAIELKLGKQPKSKESPRKIDIDILFFGQDSFINKDLIIPHPRWHERLFVLKPLSELVKELVVPAVGGGHTIINLSTLLINFPNRHGERVIKL